MMTCVLLKLFTFEFTFFENYDLFAIKIYIFK